MLITYIYLMTFCTYPADTCVTIQIRQTMHGTYNVTMRRVHVTIVAVEKQYPGRTWKLTYDGLPIDSTYAEVLTASGKQLLQNLLEVERKLIGTAIDQKPTGEDRSHSVGCRTATWKERRDHHIVIS
jgi:hypothetical protein